MNRLFFSISFLIISGCISTFPKDINIVSIELVNEKSQPEIPAPIKTKLIPHRNVHTRYMIDLEGNDPNRLIKKEDMEAFYKWEKTASFFREAKSGDYLYRIEFSTKENIYEYSKSNDYDLSNISSLCNKNNDHIRFPPIYWEGLKVSAFYNLEINKNFNDKYLYYTFLRAYDRDSGGSPREKYDLIIKPEDICFQIGGKSLSILPVSGYSSKIVVIPEIDIRKANIGFNKN